MSHSDNLQDDVKDLAFSFFYRFARFEFALKDNGKVKASGFHKIAEPDWNAFVKEFHGMYLPSEAAKELLDSPPDVQRYKNGNTWEWEPLILNAVDSDLSRTVLVVKTVRNNLFHGGKHHAKGWDEPDRVRFLLSRGIEVLDSFARLAGYEADYWRVY
jgi:hypothetical protein